LDKAVVAEFRQFMLVDWMLFMQCNLSLGMTKRSYVEAVINGFKAVETANVIFETRRDEKVMENFEHDHESEVDLKSTIHVKLLLSIDRRESTQSAIETVGIITTFLTTYS
jgi:adenosine deaminase